MITNAENSYLVKKLLEKNIDFKNTDPIFLDFKANIFTGNKIPKDICKKIHKEYLDRIEYYKNLSDDILIVFASSTGVNDISINHDGSTCYNLAKLMTENWLLNSNKKYIILRIGTIYSTHKKDYNFMKKDRIPYKIFHNKISDLKDLGISNLGEKDYYLDIDNFVDTTIYEIENYNKNKIVKYNLEKLSIIDLKRKIQSEK